MPSTSLPNAERAARLDRLERMANTLDRAYRLPIVGVRVGWDSILGLIPGVGDALAFGPAAFILYEAHQLGARKHVLARMALNTGIDTLIGSIPLIGDIFDVAFKSNRRNVALLRSEMQRDAPLPKGARYA